MVNHSDAAPGKPKAGDDVIDTALKILNESDPELKALYTQEAYTLWQTGDITLPSPDAPIRTPPSTPARAPNVRLVAPSQLASRKGACLASLQAMLHALVHIECCAIDLAWDIIARFGALPEYASNLPIEFFKDFVTVSADEARHFSMLLKRLRETGMEYGDLPAHDGLWESAMETANSLPARLAIEHCTHEARGLDVLPQTIQKFRGGGDKASASLLEDVIYPEEISHCAAGVRWLRHLHALALHWKEQSEQGEVPGWVEDARQHTAVELWFHALVRRHYYGALKPPFNEVARAKAGFGPEWYLPLTNKALGKSW